MKNVSTAKWFKSSYGCVTYKNLQLRQKLTAATKKRNLPHNLLITVNGEHCESRPVEKAAQILNLNEGGNVTAETALAFHFGQLERAPT